MSIPSTVLPLIQTAVQGWLQFKVATEGKKIAIKTARAYVQGVRAARLLSLILLGLAALAILNIFALGILFHAGYSIYWSDPNLPISSWAIGEIVTGSSILFLDLVVVVLVANERLWMNIFNVPSILDAVLSEETSTKVRFS